MFVCAGCGSPLFDATTKYNSGTGWPSFYAALDGAVEERVDKSIPFMPRTVRDRGRRREGEGCTTHKEAREAHHCTATTPPLSHPSAHITPHITHPNRTGTGHPKPKPQEIHCAVCKGHLGHSFPDGPPPTFTRYCMNGVAMAFVANDA
jgi:peptide-methionine (R)-S-oxide reductase